MELHRDPIRPPTPSYRPQKKRSFIHSKVAELAAVEREPRRSLEGLLFLPSQSWIRGGKSNKCQTQLLISLRAIKFCCLCRTKAPGRRAFFHFFKSLFIWRVWVARYAGAAAVYKLTYFSSTPGPTVFPRRLLFFFYFFKR